MLEDSAVFGERQFFQAEALKDEVTSALARLAARYGDQGERAIDYARRWLPLDPLHEPAHRELMGLYLKAGQRSVALRQYRQCLRTLEEALGAAPSEKARAL